MNERTKQEEGSLRLSVIVPVYNVENYLRRCMDSLFRQGLKEDEWELVCVDDGSTDGSAAILQEYRERHSDLIKVITQENQGVSAARNAGLDAARGEYVAFMDSDDLMVDGGYQYLLEHFCPLAKEQGGEADRSKKQPDVVAFWAVTMNPYQMAHGTHSDLPEGEAIFEGDGVEMYNRDGWNGCTTRLFRRDFIERHALRFEPMAVCEDALFFFRLCQQHPHVVMTNCNFYRYMQDNKNSAVRSTAAATLGPKIDGMLRFMEGLNAYLDSGETAMQQGIETRLNALVLAIYTRSLAAHFSRKEWSAHMSRLKAQPRHTLHMGGKWALLGRMLNTTSTSYLAYRLFTLLYEDVFNRFVRQRLA